MTRPGISVLLPVVAVENGGLLAQALEAARQIRGEPIEIAAPQLVNDDNHHQLWLPLRRDIGARRRDKTIDKHEG